MKQIIDILHDNKGRIDFTESLTVKMSPHTPPVKMVGVFLNRERIYVILKDGIIKPATTDNVVNSILQRLKLMKFVQHVIK